MTESLLLLLLVILLALIFDFVNGFHDASNAIATSVATRVLTPRVAVSLAAVMNLIGALSGTAVAKTVGFGIIGAEAIRSETLIAALLTAILWNLLTWYLGLPSSSSHALMAGLVGAGLSAAGVATLQWAGLKKILLAIVISPLLGFTLGMVVMVVLLRVFQHVSPATVTRVTTRMQVLSATYMAFSHGSNDAQKSMGVIAVALATYLGSQQPHIPLWVIVACALAMALGTAIGGWRIMRTMGWRLTNLKPVHGFAAEFSAATVIEAASRLGIPISTTHIINSSIMGVGSTRRLSAVKWGVGMDIVTAWILTIPACTGLAWILESLLKFVLH